ncbi:MAG: hypothetical protein IPG25_02705 [Proteobacteria bacterium]|mgnify:FL=1|nr:hypothetical protein [Pseudomonadota bacterium]
MSRDRRRPLVGVVLATALCAPSFVSAAEPPQAAVSAPDGELLEFLADADGVADEGFLEFLAATDLDPIVKRRTPPAESATKTSQKESDDD